MTDGPLPAVVTAQGPRPPARPLLLGIGTLAVLLTGVVGLLVARTSPGVDERWMTIALGLRGEPWSTLARGLDWLGGHVVGIFVVPLLVTALLYRFRGRWAAAFFLVASVASALAVQVLKALFDRARPEDMLVTADRGSFPSGHTANAATMAVALGVILPRLWVWIAGALYAVLMALSRTYLGAHWLTDTVGGLLVGAGVAMLCWAGFSLRLLAPSPPPPAIAAGHDPAELPGDSAGNPDDPGAPRQ
jgi:undecaprenyl-diphosphatase